MSAFWTSFCPPSTFERLWPSPNSRTFENSHFCSVQGNVGLGDFGGLNANANLNLPNPVSAGNNLLMMAIIGLGVISLINTIATIAVPFFVGKDAEETPEDAARRMRMLHYVRDNVIDGIQAFAEKYANQQ